MSDALERAWRSERSAVVATLARRLGDLQLAEDAVQEAYAAAAMRWPTDGVPDRPGAWITVVAWRRALDTLRRERRLAPELADIEAPVDDPHTGSTLNVEDDRLALILACCHPALAPEAQIALTLRHVAGLTPREIATAFLLGEDALAKRLVRARQKLRDGRIRFDLPDHNDLYRRLDSVRAVISLIFSEGHFASGDGPTIRQELCEEAIWLARQLHALTPHDQETTGLLAMMLLHNARAAAREDDQGIPIPFDDQDPDLWDSAAIGEAKQLLTTTGRGGPGPYQLQAAIAVVQVVAGQRREPIPWLHICRLYEVLLRIAPTPVVAVHHASAIGRAHGHDAELIALSPLLADAQLANYAPMHAAHAELLDRSGRHSEAVRAWDEAIRCTPNGTHRQSLYRRAEKSSQLDVLSRTLQASYGSDAPRPSITDTEE